MTAATTQIAAPEAPSAAAAPVEGVRIPGPYRFATASAWHESLGGVPLERIRFDPPPGSATIEQALEITERETLVELVNGTLIEKATGFWESNIAVHFGHALMTFTDEHGLGVIFGPNATLRMLGGNMRMPDASFVSKDRVPVDDAPVPLLCPDLAVEILSESNTAEEIRIKRAELFSGGTRLMWVIDARTGAAVVYTDGTADGTPVPAEGHLNGGDVLPGFRVSLTELFEGVPDPE